VALPSEGFQPPYCFRPQLPVVGRGREGGWVSGRALLQGLWCGREGDRDRPCGGRNGNQSRRRVLIRVKAISWLFGWSSLITLN